MISPQRTPAKKMARELAKYLRGEQPDYPYLKSVFRELRAELEVTIPRATKTLPFVPSEEEVQRFYETVWQARDSQDIILIKTLFYTGVRISELVHIRLEDVDLMQRQIRINASKGGKDRVVPFPPAFKEALAMHMEGMQQKGAVYLFESSWKRKYSDRGVRSMFARYTQRAGLTHSISPHDLRHFLFTWLKKQGIDDASIQPYSGHASRQSLEIYSRLAVQEAQRDYNKVIKHFPV